MSFGHLGAAIWHRWAFIYGQYYADKPETIDALKDNIRKTIGEIKLHTIDNVLKNWTDREWNYFTLLIVRIVLSNKNRNLRKYSVIFLSIFQKKNF